MNNVKRIAGIVLVLVAAAVWSEEPCVQLTIHAGAESREYRCVPTDTDSLYISVHDLSRYDAFLRGIDRIDGLTRLPNLRELIISVLPFTDTYAYLGELSQLEILTIGQANVTDLSFLTGLRALKEFHLEENFTRYGATRFYEGGPPSLLMNRPIDLGGNPELAIFTLFDPDLSRVPDFVNVPARLTIVQLLQVPGWEIGPESVRALEALSGVEHLILAGAELSPEVQRRFPNISTEYLRPEEIDELARQLGVAP